MADHEPRVRLKFKCIRLRPYDLVPQGYRLATVEEFRNNKDILREWGREVRLLSGSHFRTWDFEWMLAVKKKEWDNGSKKWRNCSAFYSSGGDVLRKQLYDGITLDDLEQIALAWFNACNWEDAEALYWLWQNYRSPFNSEIDFLFRRSSPLEKTVERMGCHEPGSQLQMENPREEVEIVLNYAIHESTSDWGLVMVELFVQVYGKPFVETAAAMTFSNVESIPIFTKLLSLSLHQFENQIPNIKARFSEVLTEAVERGYTALVKHLMLKLRDDIPHIPKDDCVRVLTAALHRRGSIQLVEILLDLIQSQRRDGVELQVEVDDKGRTLFHYALFSEQVFRRLQEMYAGLTESVITRKDKAGRNILHWAAKGACDSDVVYDILEGSISSAERLILSDHRDDRGRTPLHIAASKGNSGMIEKLLSYFQNVGDTKYIQETDFSGRTALHMAAGGGHVDSIQILLQEGSKPAKERDGQKRTALHHAALVRDPKVALATCKALIDKNPSADMYALSFLLWASATGIGTADEMEGVHADVKTYVRRKKEEHKEDLLRKAAVTNNVEMAWELLNRGADMADILDPKWRKTLNNYGEDAVKNVISHMNRMRDQGRDQPSMDDNLGRHVFAEGVAALLLNRFVESPITVGISGEWGMGKSSLMIQIEKILLITAAQLTFPNLLPSEQFGGAKKISLSTRGRKIYRQIKRGIHNLLPLSKNKSENPVVTVLMKYQSQYHAVYKSLACMDINQMLQSKSVSQQPEQEHALRGVPRILTIRYNAWHYRDRHQAWAGLGVAITKEIENAMTRAQWMSTCWRYTWAKHRVNIWIQIFLPCLLSICLAGWVAWIVWMLLKQAKFEGLKYGSIPSTVIAIAWVVLKSVISVVKPVSTQMLGYISKPDHTSHLDYQEDVIADINFLKRELGNEPLWFFSFILGVWCWNWFGLFADVIENTKIPKFMPASRDQIRIVTFVDDLDRCEEDVILKVLSAVNLVLAECKINVILRIDKKMIARAIRRKFVDMDDEEIAEKFISKVIQIPLSLPDPTEEETKSFLRGHLGYNFSNKYMKKKNSLESPHDMVFTLEPSRGEQEEEMSDVSQQESVAACCYNTVLTIDSIEARAGCEGIIMKVVHWLGCLLGIASTVTCNISTEPGQPSDESNSLRSAEGVRLIRELLMPNYTEEEASLFYELRELASGNQRLPREWKRLLHYHKFAWYVTFRIGNIYNLPTWKEELVAWVFVCWQWKHEMNHLIKNWHKYTSNLISRENEDGRQRHGRVALLSEIVAERRRYILKQKSGTSQNKKVYLRAMEEESKSKKNWVRLEAALKIRDVSMEAIQLFQQFRFYCENDYLPWQ